MTSLVHDIYLYIHTYHASVHSYMSHICLDEENKENYMPHTASMSVCEDGIETLNKKNGPKEEMHISAEEDYDEEEQLRLAIENSLKDMVSPKIIWSLLKPGLNS